MPETSTETKINLPTDFLLGTAASAHQVEGNNMNSDWWMYEQQGRLPKSGNAADHYNRYEEDFALAKQIGLNAMRISIEWSRIEPVEGRWDVTSIEHYRKVLKKMKEEGLVRMVTLHHSTLPAWLAEKGGFETPEGIGAFGRFAWFIAQNLGPEIDFWITINEPEVYASLAYQKGVWPPFKRSYFLMVKVFNNLIRAHRIAYSAIKQVLPESKIGFAKNSPYFEPFRRNNFMDKLLVRLLNNIRNHYFIKKIKDDYDFVGINYYFYDVLKFDAKKLFIKMDYNLAKNRPEEVGETQRSDMGWRTYPEGLYHLLIDLKKYNKPIYITENGIANARDDMRQDFIRQHLQSVQKAIDKGVDVKGYFYWSLTDTYEWHDGFNPKFGLVEVNFETQERRIRASAAVFKEFRRDKL